MFCGSGGVGKTSVAAAAALGASVRLGGKTLVLTIDPARRLATALGLDGIGNEAHRVPAELLKIAGHDPRGELWAAMLDTKQSWDDLVLRYAKDKETAYRILENRLYHNLTARFVQSHDYIAMERLFEIHASGEYDLIVIDTPPTRNAVDFLDAPARMSDFFGGRLLRWLTLPYRVGGKRSARMINMASRPFYQLADRVLGSKFLEDIAEFFLNFQSMYAGFVERAQSVERLLHDRRTTFAVVTTLEAAPLHEAEQFCATLLDRHFHLGALVLNKTLPDTLLDPAGAAAAARFCEERGSSPTRCRRCRTRRSPIPSARPGCCEPSASRSRTSRSSRCAKPSCAPSSPACPTWSCACPASSTTSAMSMRSRPSPACCTPTHEHARRPGSTPYQAGRGGSRAPRAVGRTWRPLADLSFADLVLLAPIAGEEGHRFVVLAQVRPVTGQTSYPQDLVGTVVDEVERPLLARCWRAGESVEADTHAIGAKERVRVQCIPVRRGGRLIGLLTRESSATFAGAPVSSSARTSRRSSGSRR